MIQLRSFKEIDFYYLIKWADTPEILLQWAGPTFDFPLNNDQLFSYLHTPDQQSYTAIDDSTGDRIGHIVLGRIDKRNNQARIGKVFVSPSFRGRGVAEEMVRQTLTIAFDDLNLHKVTLGVFDFNHPAIRCYQKVGFKKDGVLRDHRRIGDEYWNTIEMSLLQKEWRT
ncbi:GNAT family N-acetyltransferase [Halobacillus locisalis]|uniref:GNAT family N-acetyltransferase n=1 Tax=Halobacillus locisalis TaxID=220753 RepID=A0A838CWN3_9BACI|nr:GNAT family protein [Halobacillus locisalis]MBA2176370.1 GNAT family N-acetyltransferase [Halobacillus locisalis]